MSVAIDIPGLVGFVSAMIAAEGVERTPDLTGLGARQRAFYEFAIGIFRPTTVLGLDGAFTGRSWSRVLSCLPCYLETTPSNFAVQGGFVLAEQDNIFTLDVLHIQAQWDIQMGDVFLLRNSPAKAAPLRGNFWVIRGETKTKGWRADKQAFVCARLDCPPIGLPS